MSYTETSTQESFDSTDLETDEQYTTTQEEAPSNLHIWINGQGRRYCRPGQDHDQTVAMSRLTAVAEFGFDAVAESDCIHHRLELFVNSRESLMPQSWADHRKIHSEDGHGFETPGDVFDRWDEDSDDIAPVTATEEWADGD